MNEIEEDDDFRLFVKRFNKFLRNKANQRRSNFNSKKKGKGVGDHGASEKRQFNQFIFGMVLENIPVPLLGKGFTWYQPNGRSKSRIKQVSSIKEMIQCLAIMYSIHFRYEYIGSHCLILLKDSKVDWGPKPFRNLNCWFQDNGFKGFVENS